VVLTLPVVFVAVVLTLPVVFVAVVLTLPVVSVSVCRRVSLALALVLTGRHRFAREERGQVARREPPANVEGAELAVAGARFVVAHLVDDVLEVRRVLGEERHAPLPVVEADRGGDDLFHAAAELPAVFAVFLHHLAAALEGQVVPVVLLAPLPAHRVEAEVLVLGYLGL